MRKTTQPSRTWFQRLFSHIRSHRGPSQRTGENTIVGPISTNAIASAENALRWISKVPGGDKPQARIGVVLEMIKRLNVASAQDATIHDAKTLRWLEYHIRYLAELLEPFAVMHRYQISPFLQREVLTLSRELETALSKMKQAAPPKKAPRWYSLRTKGVEEECWNAADLRAFTLDFKFALDEFRGNGLPLYPISPIEAALLPLGVISNSSCALLPFIEWILKSERVMEYRIGAVHTIKLYHHWVLYGRQRRDFGCILVGLGNRRGIENWLKIGLPDPHTQETVTFSSTREALDEDERSRLFLSSVLGIHIAEDTLSVTHFAQQIKDIFPWHGGSLALIRRLRHRFGLRIGG